MKPSKVLIERFLAVFGEPRTDNVPLFLREFEGAIAGWDEVTLKQAGDRLIREAKFWPRPAEVNDLCHALMPAPSNDMKKDVTWTGDAIRVANHLIHSDLGRQAAGEGWIGPLHDHCRVHRTLPTPSEVVVLKQQGKATDQAYRDCVEGNGGVFGEGLANFGATMMAKRRQLSEIAHGRRHDLGMITDAFVHFPKPKARFKDGQVFGTPKKVAQPLTERSRRMQGGDE